MHVYCMIQAVKENLSCRQYQVQNDCESVKKTVYMVDYGPPVCLRFYSFLISHADHSRSAWVGRWGPSVCLLSVCPEHNSKTNDPQVFKLGIVNDLGISYSSDVVLQVKGQRSRSQG